MKIRIRQITDLRRRFPLDRQRRRLVQIIWNLLGQLSGAQAHRSGTEQIHVVLVDLEGVQRSTVYLKLACQLEGVECAVG